MASLFMTRREEEGLLDIGKHCNKCQKLDFLPFTCDFCRQVFCEDHRFQIAHQCTVERPQKINLAVSKDSLEPVATLFPNRNHDRLIIDQKLHALSGKPTTIADAQAARSDTSALTKIARFFQERREKIEKASRGGSTQGNKGSFFSRLSGGKNSGSSGSSIGANVFNGGNGNSKSGKGHTALLVEAKRAARGDAKIPVAERVYLWCRPVGVDGFSGAQAVWVSKKWPVGRGMDSIAETLRIKNVNNSSVDAGERLRLFLEDNDVPVSVETSARCSSLKQGDTVYLVRGT